MNIFIYLQENREFCARLALLAALVSILLLGPNVQAGSSSGSSGSSGGSSGSQSSTQQAYNSYVAQNACGCYSSSAVNQASSGGNVQSRNVYTPGYYGGSSVGGNSAPTSGSGYTSGGTNYVDPRTGINWTVDNIHNTSSGPVGVANYGGARYDVTYSNYSSAVYGYDVWVVNDPRVSGSSSSGSSGSGGGKGSNNNGGNNNGSTPTILGGQSGSYVQQCTSSGKGGQSCSWVWVPNQSSGSGICETYSCSGGAGPSNSNNGNANNNSSAAEQGALSIDASPRLIRDGDSSTITWSSSGANSCIVSGPNSFTASGTSGSQAATGINEQSTYTLTCQFNSGSQSATVTVNIIPVWREF